MISRVAVIRRDKSADFPAVPGDVDGILESVFVDDG